MRYEDIFRSCPRILTQGRPALRGCDTRERYKADLQRCATRMRHQFVYEDNRSLPVETAGGARDSTARQPGKAFPVVRSRRVTQAPDTGNHSSSFAALRNINTLTGDRPGRLNPARNSAKAVQETTPRPSQGLPGTVDDAGISCWRDQPSNTPSVAWLVARIKTRSSDEKWPER